MVAVSLLCLLTFEDGKFSYFTRGYYEPVNFVNRPLYVGLESCPVNRCGRVRFYESAWAPLIEEGQHILTAHAWVGVRAMPAQGGAPDLALNEFADAVAWMARASGGDWQTPDAAMMARIRHEAAERLEKEIKEKKALRKKLEHD